MPTTQTTANNYNGSSYGTYNAFQPQIQSSLMQMATNPLGSSYFQNQLAQNQQNAVQIGQRNISNSVQNMRTGGGILSSSGGFANALLARNTLGASNMQSNAFNSSLNSALSNRNTATMAMQAYQPLQTGQTQSTGGLGTWLPQVAGAAMNMLMPGVGSMLGGSSFSAGYGGGSSNFTPGFKPTQTANPFAGIGSAPPPMDSSVYNGMGGNSYTPLPY